MSVKMYKDDNENNGSDDVDNNATDDIHRSKQNVAVHTCFNKTYDRYDIIYIYIL